MKLKTFVPTAIATAGIAITCFVVPSTFAAEGDGKEPVSITQSSSDSTPSSNPYAKTQASKTIELAEDTTKMPSKTNVKKLDLTKIRGGLQEEQKKVEKEKEDRAEAERQEQQRVQQERAQETSTTTSKPSTSFTAPPVTSYGNDVVAAAMSRIGTPYVYGGTNPNVGFDCSGLVQWSYAQVGKSIPRVSGAQIMGGTPVPLDSLQPGDIIGYYSGISHVGIYIGNGQVVHAPTEGQTVTVADLHHAPISGAARY